MENSFSEIFIYKLTCVKEHKFTFIFKNTGICESVSEIKEGDLDYLE